MNTAENYNLEVVFVLDFTNSMAKMEVPGFQNGIEAMVETIIKAIDVLPEAHRVGVVEFHDKNLDPSTQSTRFW